MSAVYFWPRWTGFCDGSGESPLESGDVFGPKVLWNLDDPEGHDGGKQRRAEVDVECTRLLKGPPFRATERIDQGGLKLPHDPQAGADRGERAANRRSPRAPGADDVQHATPLGHQLPAACQVREVGA